MKKSITILLLLCSMAVMTSCSNKEIEAYRLRKSSKSEYEKHYSMQDTIENRVKIKKDLVLISKTNRIGSCCIMTVDLRKIAQLCDSTFKIGSALKYERGELAPTPCTLNTKVKFYSDSNLRFQVPSSLLNPDYSFFSSNKPLIKVSSPQPDSSYHVWIDKKSITWTSDSTFVLKIKLTP